MRYPALNGNIQSRLIRPGLSARDDSLNARLSDLTLA